MSLPKSLNDPVRIAQIKSHREKAKRSKLAPSLSSKIRVRDSTPFVMMNHYVTRKQLTWIRLKEMNLNEMTHSGSNIYYGSFVELTIIEEGYLEYSFEDRATAFHFLVEDRNKDVITLQVFGLPDNENTGEIFAVGTTLFLRAPFCRLNLSKNSRRWLRVGETGTRAIMPVGRRYGMCRYCGKEKAEMKCSKCGDLYCNRECQSADWKILKHKLVCQKKEETSGSKSVNGSSMTPAGKGKAETGKEDMPKVRLSPSKSHLNDPLRVGHILNIRLKFNMSMSILPIFHPDFLFPGGDPTTSINSFIPPKTTMKKPLDLKPIFLRGMEHDRFYESRFIEVTIIDEPVLGYAAIHFVVEDKNRDVTNLAVNGLPQSKETCERLSFGTMWMVVNPVYKIGATDDVPMIRVDDLKMMVYLGKKENMCRYCGDEKAKMQCAKCERLYCGKECQDKDWNVLKHELVCEFSPFP